MDEDIGGHHEIGKPGLRPQELDQLATDEIVTNVALARSATLLVERPTR